MLAGNYENQRKLLKVKIQNCFFNIACEGILFIWLMLYLPRVSTSRLYLAEKIWLASWILS